ncbi:MAG: hypothetical protein H7Y27_10750 [Gemmatimonadaceae bacterium]|nr:hypothetical protein [Chitinophagaceae bacterium]
MLKKILRISLIVLVVFIGVAFAAPFLFRGKIIAFAKKELNSSLNAKADFKDISISFFRHFPRVSVALQELQIVGIDQFSQDTLFSAKDIDVALNLMSVIKGSNFKIYSINIDEPRIHLIVQKDGRANWDIVKSDSTSTDTAASSKPFQLDLKEYSINNGYVSYIDSSSAMSSEIVNLNHSGSGNFNSDVFTLKTNTAADELTFTYGGVPYLSKTKTSIDADIEVDNRTSKYSFRTDEIALNELKLSTNGFFQLINDSTYNMDVSFKAPSTDFKNILSLIPVVYAKDFSKIKTSGEAIFSGDVKGIYSSDRIPAYHLDLAVKNGFFQYPDLPKPVKNIQLKMQVDNPDGVTDHTVVNIPAAHIELDNDPFDFRLLVKTPVSDMFIDAAAKGRLDLSKVAQLVKLEAGTSLKGLLNADVSVNGYVSAAEKQQYEKFNAAGTVALSSFRYASKDYPDGVTLNSLLASFNPRNITLSELEGSYMKTNFSATGAINNLLPYLLKNQALNGDLKVKADKINVNDFIGTTDTSAATTSTASAPFLVPANLDFTVTAAVGNVRYDNLDMQNMSGSVVIKDETLGLYNLKTDALDGQMLINGSYSTKTDHKKPDIKLSYDVSNLDIQKTFYAFNTVQKIMPAGKFLGGKLNSKLTMTGKLGGDMMPDLASLTGEGSLLLIEGFLKKFAPLEKLASTLNIKDLENISLRDVKNYFEFTNGKVFVKPFTIKVKDIAMEIGGMHGFDQTIDYVINMKVPRALMGSDGNAFVNNLVTQVNNKGIPVKVGDVVSLNVKMGGTLTNPILKTDLKQTANSLAEDLKKQATDFAKAKIDSAKTAVTTAVKDTFSAVKKQVLQSAADELKKQVLGGKKDSTQTGGVTDGKKKVEESAKGLIDNIFKKKKPAADTTKKQ